MFFSKCEQIKQTALLSQKAPPKISEVLLLCRRFTEAENGT